MYRLLLFFFAIGTLASCSKREVPTPTPVAIPPILDGVITEFSLLPQDLTTPGQGMFVIYSGGIYYKVDFQATTQAQSDGFLTFATDTILNDQSREFSNLGIDEIAYFPVAQNQVIIFFNDGRKVTGVFDANATFGGVFGHQVIAGWRDPADPAKPTQKAEDDIIQLVHRYKDKDGPGPETDHQYLLVNVSRR